MAKSLKKPDQSQTAAPVLWIRKPKALRPVVKDGEFAEYETVEGSKLHWSGISRLPPVGAQIPAWFRQLGTVTVKGYFVDRGWLGVIVQRPTAKDDQFEFLMGSELGDFAEPAEPRKPVVKAPAHKKKSVKRTRSVAKATARQARHSGRQ
jgi:hypothetical protein